MRNIIVILIIGSLSFRLFGQSIKIEPVDFADPLMGTSSSHWTLFPGPGMPFGMVKLSPDNQRSGWKAGYDYNVLNIAGFSHIHSWTMGGLLIMPTTGKLKILPGSETNPEMGYRSKFRHENEVAKPGYYSVYLDDYKIKAELTATTRAGFQRYTFPKSDSARILIDLKIPTEYGYEIFNAKISRVSNTEIEGYSIQQSLHGAGFNEYTLHFVIRFNKPFETFNGWKGEEIFRDTTEVYLTDGDEDIGAFLNFRTNEGEEIMVQSGISLVSIDQARLNLESELDPFVWNFNAVKENNRTAWNNLLQSIEVEGGTDNDYKKFYTNIYRAYSGQTIWSDVNGKYVDMYEKVQQLNDPDSPVYGCETFGNTFWNLNQLWTLSQPDIASKWVRSLLEIYDKGGWLPDGSSGVEYSGITIPSHEISLMVSAYQKGIRNFDIDKMYKAIVHNQTEPGKLHSGGGFAGNRNLESYLKAGFVPNDEGTGFNTLEYAFDDWTVSQMAKALGNESDYKTFAKRAFNYKNIFNTKTGYFCLKNSDGSLIEDSSKSGHLPLNGSGYIEGNAWKCTYFVPHDINGLIELSGKDEFVIRLEKELEESLPFLFNSENPLNNSLTGIGILPVNYVNRFNMQAAYLFNYAGKPWLTQKWIREIMSRYYGDSVNNKLPYDEEQGQNGAWYVMSAMGLFQMDGGTSVNPFYEIGSPVFEKITIHLDTNYYPGNKFIIEAKNVSERNRYIQSATLDGKPLSKSWFYHSELVDGGRLVLKMGPEPNNKWGINPRDVPPSMSSLLSSEQIKDILKYDKNAEFLEAWNKALKAYYYHKKEHFETLPNTKNEIIFLGNSITDNCEWAELFGNPNIKNRGIGGDDTDGILERLTEVTESNPLKIFIMIGTNDLSNSKSIDYIVENYRKIINRIKQSTPGTEIYVQSIIPTDDAIHTTRKNSDIIKINTQLKLMAEQDGLTYIDLFSVFKLDNNKLNPEYSLDGLHLNGKGYMVWKKEIEKYILN
jgi:predicted alpha-1,2-mannosidase